MSERIYKTIVKNDQADADLFIVSSISSYDLGAFLIFSGLVGGVPLYYLFSSLVLRNGTPNLLPGVILSLLVAAIGIYSICFAQERVKVFDEAGSGKIVIQDGYFGTPMTYTYGNDVKIRLSVSEVSNGKLTLDCWEVTLLAGRCQFLLDSRIARLQESRALAEFLVKSIHCNLLLVLEAGKTIEMHWKDMDLPYCERVSKYPELAAQHPTRPQDCPITVEDINYGEGRRYSWRLASPGANTEIFALAAMAFVIGVVPFLGSDNHRYSFFNEAMRTGDWTFFIGAALLFFVVFAVQFGCTSTIEIDGHRVNLKKRIWGLTYRQKTIILDALEGVLARKASTQNSIMFISDATVFSAQVSSAELADYLVADVQYFLTSGKSVVKPN